MKVLVVDDHTLIRAALRNVLLEIDPSAQLVEAADGTEALAAAGLAGDFDLALLDIHLPDMDGLFALGALRRQHPSTAVVVISGERDPAIIAAAVDLGAVGYIPKSSAHAVMLGALQLICAGGVYLPPDIMAARGRRAIVPTSGPVDLGLSAREAQVLEGMLEGKPNKVIARELGITEATTKNHVTEVLKALNATNRTQAVIAAGRLNWRPPASPGKLRSSADE